MLKLLAIKLALFSFTKEKRVKVILVHKDNKAALSNLLKMEGGGTKKEHMVKLSKRDLPLSSKSQHHIKYLSSVLNTVADKE